jgi:hypothetical protein
MHFGSLPIVKKGSNLASFPNAEVAKDGVADNHDRTILACYGFHSVALGFE